MRLAARQLSRHAIPRDAPFSRNTTFGSLKRSNSHPRSGNTHIGDEHVRISRAGATFLQLDSQICSWIRGSDAVHLSMQPLAEDIPPQALSQQGPAGCAQRTSINSPGPCGPRRVKSQIQTSSSYIFLFPIVNYFYKHLTLPISNCFYILFPTSNCLLLVMLFFCL